MARYTRIALYLDAFQKRLLERVAAHLGLSLSDFAHDAVLREVRRIITSDGDAILTQAESSCFLNAHDLPFQPNAKSTKALKRTK